MGLINEQPLPLAVPSHIFEVNWHPDPQTHLFGSCHVSSAVHLWKLNSNSNHFEEVGCLNHHKKSCRTGQFLLDGEHFVSGSSDCQCVIANLNGKVVWSSPSNSTDGHRDAVNVVRVLDHHLIASGDDEGFLKVWDIRKPPGKPSVSFQEYEEVIFSIEYDGVYHPESLLVTTGDCLAVFDMRKPSPHLHAMSDPQEADLLCCKVVKGGTKVLCGTATSGAISIFSWGDFGDMSDRIANHGVSVDHIIVLPMDEFGNDVILTGAGDGLIRVVSVFPHNILGTLGTHNDDEEAIEILSLSTDGSYLISGSHDGVLRFHSTTPIGPMRDRAAGRTPDPDALAAVQAMESKNEFFSDL